jgi:hypothetical protein
MDGRPNADAARAWVGCLGCYNAGRLVGAWFDADDAPTSMEEFDHAGVFRPWVHFAEVHEELWVFDHEGFGGVLAGECSPVQLRELAELIDEARDRGIPVQVVAHWVSDGNSTADTREFLDGLQDAYCGHFDTGADYAQHLADEIGSAPADTWPYNCLDWERAWRELQYGGDNYAISAADGGVLIFRAI